MGERIMASPVLLLLDVLVLPWHRIGRDRGLRFTVSAPDPVPNGFFGS